MIYQNDHACKPLNANNRSNDLMICRVKSTLNNVKILYFDK